MSESTRVYPLESANVEAVPPVAQVPAAETGVRPFEQSPGKLPNAVKWTFSFAAMLGTFLVGRVFYQARQFFVDPDVWWHIRIGQDILKTHHWPTTAPYSLTAPNLAWIAYEWLGDVIVGSVYQRGGTVAMFVLLILCGAAAMLGLYYYGALRSGNCKAGFVPAGLMCSLAFLSFTLRPQMFGYLCLVALLIVLEWFRKGVSWPLWILPVLFLFWVNAHGSFVIGIGVLTVYLCCGLKSFQFGSIEAIAWTQKQRMQLELALLGSLAVLPVTPYGTQLAVYPFDMMFSQPINVANISEWRPMPFDQTFGKIFLGVAVLVVVLQLMYRMTWRFEEALLALGGAFMACIHARMLLLFVPFLVPVFAVMMAKLLPPYDRKKEHYVLNGVLMAGVVAAMAYYFPSRQLLRGQLEAYFPVKAVEYLDTHEVPGPMLNAYYFGGYLVNTGRKVFIDGRGDLYEKSGVLADYLALTEIQPGAFSVLDRYHVASCLLYRNEKLATVLGHSPDWKKVYSDETVVLFVRKDKADAMKATAQQ
jgi:hypothetical protein